MLIALHWQSKMQNKVKFKKLLQINEKQMISICTRLAKFQQQQ